MIAVDIASAKSSDLRASVAAMKRAAELARSIAIRTNTGIVIVRDNKTIVVSANELGEKKTKHHKRMESDTVEHGIPVNPLDFAVRIEELKLLKRGWLDGKGEALDPTKLDWVVEAFQNYFAGDAKLPYLFPTPEGNLLAEWLLGDNSVSLEIDLSTGQADWHILNLTSSGEETKVLDLSKPDSWEWLSNAVKEMGCVSE